MDHESLVIVLATGGAPLDGDALAAVTGVRAVWVRVEREGRAACLAARVRHGERPEALRDRLRRWGAARGWAVTTVTAVTTGAVAPGGPPC